ncbi:Bardet-Biedl syndrome 10 protein [Embiotoca jacksoni]|uniref:Bardet-Biedl syndrome 10 protein n=1 Tax=Embiotoca jacksoni TaxID=100190 RepID=UPI0037041889
MLPLAHCHLKQVLQTVCALESVILRSFGPDGGQVLFTRDTGQAMLSRSGTQILTALQLEHPLARMVVECVWKHSTVTGDGSKTFVLLLASLLRMIHATAGKEPNLSRSYNSTKAAEAATARHMADKLFAFALKELDHLIAVKVIPYGCFVSLEDFTANTQSHVQKLLVSFFHTRLGHTHCDFISDLTCELLSHWKFKNDLASSSLEFVNDNFLALHTPVSGFPISSSRLIEGQVIHRDFSTPLRQTDHQPIKAVVFTESLQPKLLNTGDVLEVGCAGRVLEGRSIVHFSAWMERSLEGLIANLQTLGVSVLLSAVKQSAAVLALAKQAEMCCVECVSEDELSLFAKLSGATPVSDCKMIGPEHVASLSFCRPIQLGALGYVHVGFQDPEEKVVVKPCSLVICAPGEGQTEQYTRAFQDAIRMLLATTSRDPMRVSAIAASKRTLRSHKCTSLQTDKQTDRTTYGSSNIRSFYECAFEPGCVIPAGGTFEFLLNHALLQHARCWSVLDDSNIGIPVSQLLANALLSVPRQIYSHRSQRFLQTQTRVRSLIPNPSHPVSLVHEQERDTIPVQTEGPLQDGRLSLHCYGTGDVSSNVFLLDLGLESVSCKYQLLLAVLQCVTSLLRVDTVLHTHTALHTQSRRLVNTSWEDTEDED